MTELKERYTCRVCESPFEEKFSLGNLHLSDFFAKEDTEPPSAPLDIVQCTNEKCGLVQLRHTAPMDFMYTRHYWYRSSINPVIVKDLEDIAVQIHASITTDSDEQRRIRWIDVGANDGALLRVLPPHLYHRIAVEPAANFTEDLRMHAEDVFADFWENYNGALKADVITAIGMFYDSEDPNLFMKKVVDCLAPGGIFVAQLMTLAPMIRNNDIGNICHEHLEYYSYKSLKFLYEKNGLEIYAVEQNDINGGSYRIWARKFRKGSIDFEEEEIDLDAFKSSIDRNKAQTVDFIKERVAEGKKVYGYGASTKGNTILQYYGLGKEDIVAIADRNIEKHGLITPGSHIEVISEEDARKEADYFFVLPYAFIDKFVERESSWIKEGGKLFVSTPKFKII